MPESISDKGENNNIFPNTFSMNEEIFCVNDLVGGVSVEKASMAFLESDVLLFQP